MNKPKFYLLPLILLLLICSTARNANANNIAGGELVYEWLGGPLYRVYVRLYVDCAAGVEPASVTMCATDPCFSNSFTRTLNKVAPSPPWPPMPPMACPQFKSQCDSPSSAIPGFKQWWYTDVVTLGTQCNNWTFSVTIPGRAATNTIPNATATDMYLESTINNTGSYFANNSPIFGTPPATYVCYNTVNNFHSAIADVENDSISVEIVNPRSSSGSCPALPVSIPLAPVSPPLAIPGNPIQTNNTFSMDHATGIMTFTPTQLGRHTLAVRVNEYRNGTKIGSVMRELPFHALNCAPQLTFAPVNIGCISGAAVYNSANNGIDACPEPFSFCFTVKSNDPTAKLSVSDNHILLDPGSSVTYVNQYTDSVTGTFTGSPPLNYNGAKIFTISVVDTVCKFPAGQGYYQFSVPVYIWPPTGITADTNIICQGDATTLHAAGSGNYQWTVLSGTPGSLSCTNCSNPVATPSVTSRYTVSSLGNGYCSALHDTITIYVAPKTYPSVGITVSPGSTIPANTNASFIAIGSGCNSPAYQWQRNGVDVPGATNSTWTTSLLGNMDVIRCRLTCSDTCALPNDTISNAITMHVFNSIKEADAAQHINVYPNPNKGHFTIAGTAFTGAKNIDIEVVSSIGQIVYRQKINKSPDASELTIQPPAIAPGLYHLKVKAGEKVYNTQFAVEE